MKLYAIRHGETNMGRQKVIATIEEPLNATGINQAMSISDEVNLRNIDIVFCSPINRARDTLAYFNLLDTIPVIIDYRIIERDMGKYIEVPYKSLD